MSDVLKSIQAKLEVLDAQHQKTPQGTAQYFMQSVEIRVLREKADRMVAAELKNGST